MPKVILKIISFLIFNLVTEFRILSSGNNVVIGALNSTVIDLDNVSKTNGQTIVSSTKQYYKFQYVYQFSGEGVIHTYYQLN
jgi:hypothetical protein